MTEKETAKKGIWRFSLEHEEKETLPLNEESGGKELLDLEEEVKSGRPILTDWHFDDSTKTKAELIKIYFSWLLEGGFLEYRTPECETRIRMADGMQEERLARTLELWRMLDCFTHEYDYPIYCAFEKCFGELYAYRFLCHIIKPQRMEIYKDGNKTVGIELCLEREGYHAIGTNLRSHMWTYCKRSWSYNGDESRQKYVERWDESSWYWQMYEQALLCVLKSGYVDADISRGKKNIRIWLMRGWEHNRVMMCLGECCKLVESVIDPIIFGEQKPAFREVELNAGDKEAFAKGIVLKWCQENYSFMFEK